MHLHFYPLTFFLMAIVNMVSRILVIVGAINWGLVGAWNWNLVQMLVGSISGAEMVVYILVGLAGLYEAYNYCMTCTSKK